MKRWLDDEHCLVDKCRCILVSHKTHEWKHVPQHSMPLIITLSKIANKKWDLQEFNFSLLICQPWSCWSSVEQDQIVFLCLQVMMMTQQTDNLLFRKEIFSSTGKHFAGKDKEQATYILPLSVVVTEFPHLIQVLTFPQNKK